ncbi:replication initiator [Streptomyces sp. NPDC058695]|uniref:replication initiator n=1 Tax=Streptomyces sp. NPDC058695 TaxID=3346604 RepID=UPI003658D173
MCAPCASLLTTARDAATGEIPHHCDARHELGERLSVRCRDRLATVCVPCSRLRAGTPSTSSSPASWAVRTPLAVGDRCRPFVTLAAPPFGPVHRSGERCRPAAKQPTAITDGRSAAAARLPVETRRCCGCGPAGVSRWRTRARPPEMGGGVSRYRSGNSYAASPRLRPSPGLCTIGSRQGCARRARGRRASSFR